MKVPKSSYISALAFIHYTETTDGLFIDTTAVKLTKKHFVNTILKTTLTTIEKTHKKFTRGYTPKIEDVIRL